MTSVARRWSAAAVCAFALGAGAAPALAAKDYVGGPPPNVPPDTVPPDTVAPEVLGTVEGRTASVTVAASATEPIPITGGDIAGLTAVGLASLATGTVLVRRGRRAPG